MNEAIDEKSFETVEEPKKTAEEKQEPVWKVILDYVIYLAVVIGCCLLFIRFVAVRSVVDGNSMNPTVLDRDNLIVEKVSYYFHDPERYDVIVFELKDKPGVHYIKRIIGLPGETVQIKDGYVYINDKKLDSEVYGKEVMNSAYTAAKPVVLGANQYFVLGDNRNHSKDSRSIEVGPVDRKQFLGKAWIRFWPIWKAKVIR